MDPITLSIIVYVAHVILKHHIKETWVGKVAPVFFPKEIYKVKLEKLLVETIIEFRTKYPKEADGNKIQFFEDKETMEKLSMLILFKDGDSKLFVSDFERKENIITPTQEEIEFFFQYFVNKATSDEKLKKLHINEQYQEEIFRISSSLKSLIEVVELIKEDTHDIKRDTSLIKDGIKVNWGMHMLHTLN